MPNYTVFISGLATAAVFIGAGAVSGAFNQHVFPWLTEQARVPTNDVFAVRLRQREKNYMMRDLRAYESFEYLRKNNPEALKLQEKLNALEDQDSEEAERIRGEMMDLIIEHIAKAY